MTTCFHAAYHDLRLVAVQKAAWSLAVCFRGSISAHLVAMLHH